MIIIPHLVSIGIFLKKDEKVHVCTLVYQICYSINKFVEKKPLNVYAWFQKISKLSRVTSVYLIVHLDTPSRLSHPFHPPHPLPQQPPLWTIQFETATLFKLFYWELPSPLPFNCQFLLWWGSDTLSALHVYKTFSL